MKKIFTKILKIKDCLPNEYFFLLFLGTILLRLFLFLNFFSFETGVTLVFFFFSIWLYLGKDTSVRKNLKLYFPILCIPVMYAWIGKVVMALDLPKKDLLFQKIDQFLIGENLSFKMSFLHHPILTEIMYVSYILFFYYVLSTLVFYIRAGRTLTKSFYVGLFSIYWVGFLFYIVLPAEGPYLDMTDTFKVPLKEGLLLSGPIYDCIYQGTNKADVFPSLHCSVSAFCLFFDLKHNRRRFWLSLVLCILIWTSTLYLRYHYFIDVIAGFLLTFIALYLAKRVKLKMLAKSINRLENS